MIEGPFRKESRDSKAVHESQVLIATSASLSDPVFSNPVGAKALTAMHHMLLKVGKKKKNDYITRDRKTNCSSLWWDGVSLYLRYAFEAWRLKA